MSPSTEMCSGGPSRCSRVYCFRRELLRCLEEFLETSHPGCKLGLRLGYATKVLDQLGCSIRIPVQLPNENVGQVRGVARFRH